MADDNFDIEAADTQDPSAAFGGGIVIVTSVLLLAAVIVMYMACNEYYQVGIFAD